MKKGRAARYPPNLSLAYAPAAWHESPATAASM